MEHKRSDMVLGWGYMELKMEIMELQIKMKPNFLLIFSWFKGNFSEIKFGWARAICTDLHLEKPVDFICDLTFLKSRTYSESPQNSCSYDILHVYVAPWIKPWRYFKNVLKLARTPCILYSLWYKMMNLPGVGEYGVGVWWGTGAKGSDVTKVAIYRK